MKKKRSSLLNNLKNKNNANNNSVKNKSKNNYSKKSASTKATHAKIKYPKQLLPELNFETLMQHIKKTNINLKDINKQVNINKSKIK